jgi:hypothetical protein
MPRIASHLLRGRCPCGSVCSLKIRKFLLMTLNFQANKSSCLFFENVAFAHMTMNQLRLIESV